MRNSLAAVALAALLGTGLTACGGDDDSASAAPEGGGGTVGVAMPNKSTERWVADGNNIKEQLEEAGYDVELQYAEDDVPTQISQIENMVTKGVDTLVIAAVDGSALGSVLDTAESSGIDVIAYDRLIRDTDSVDYYATFDNFQVGVMQAESLLEGLEQSGEGPYQVELFAGDPADNNARFFYDGAMSVLQPALDAGDITVGSGQTSFEQVSTLKWSAANAQRRMEDILTSTYSSEQVQGVLSPYDGLSIGILAALEGSGYQKDELPVVTGQDAEVASVKSILAGDQYSTIFKDTRELARVTVEMIQAVGAGDEPEVNDTETYDNGVKVVPAYLLDPIAITSDNATQVLVQDAGYYTEDELK